MAVRRFFYITQDSLVVWNAVGQNVLEETRFPSSDAGYERFSSYLESVSQDRTLMVVDVIEEEFSTDSLPAVSGNDRRNLIERRMKKRFSRTPYRAGVYLGKRRRATDNFNAVYTAITNHELIDPWIELITRHRIPLIGITSIPLLSVDLLKDFRKPAENSMLVTLHQGGRLRLVFIKSGQAISARLSRNLSKEGDDFGAALISEIVQSRKYLQRSRQIGADDPLDVYFIADEHAVSSAFDNSETHFEAHIIDFREAARKLRISGELKPGNMEALYLSRCIRKRPRLEYVLRERVDYSKHLRARNFLIAAATAGAVAFSVAAGAYLTGAFVFRNQTQTINSQIAQIEETYRRENDEFQPLRADSHEMKLAVDTEDYILRNSLPIEWVMSQVGLVMADQPDIHIERLSWELESATDPDDAGRARNRSGKAMPVNIPRAAAVTANLSGEIRPYDGNLRHAFEKIDALARSLQQSTAFEHVAVAEYPIDARPGAALSGEVRRKDDKQLANFNLSLSLRVEDEVE
ncbi:MAG: hypothetical protein ACR2Q3_17875 [Woeseiaceae bacterium]